MREFIPEGDAVLCEPVPEKPAEDGAFVYENTDKLPTYVVLKAGSPDREPKVAPGDVIVCDSTGTCSSRTGRRIIYFRTAA